MNPTTLPFDAWQRRYQPESSTTSYLPFSLVRPGATGMDRIYQALRHRPAHVWTLVHRGPETVACIVPGYELVDCIGFLLTTMPYHARERHLVIPCELDVHQGHRPLERRTHPS